jgi:hypothetical protein
MHFALLPQTNNGAKLYSVTGVAEGSWPGLRGLLGAYCNLSLAASTQCGVEADILK